MNIFEFYYKVRQKFITKSYSLIYGVSFRRVGVQNKLFGLERNVFSAGVSIGDFCWIERVRSYSGECYSPFLYIGEDVSFSDMVHISCVSNVQIMDGVLIGSKVYIGDHSHGYGSSFSYSSPCFTPLFNIGSVYVGKNNWIGDGVVILANTYLCDNCVVSANSVLKNITVTSPSLIAGNPAKIIRAL